MLDWMFTKLGQKHVWVYGYKTYGSKNSPRVIWGHKGQKRYPCEKYENSSNSKSNFFTIFKMLLLLQIKYYGHVTLAY